jgi:CubicO group peptidase (beta-lactamase class C family)
MRRVIWTLAILLAIAINVIYWKDPWLWRRYAGNVLQIAGIGPRLARPYEIVEGDDGSFHLSVASAEQRTIRPTALKAAEQFAARFDSYALIVVHHGEIQTEWYASGWGPGALTQTQTMHKSLLALLIGIALERGLVHSLDDPVSRYIAEWRGEPRGRITIRQLLMMSSGLERHAFSLNPYSDQYRWLYADDTLPIILRTPAADWAPGSMFDYNNINSELLGIVLQRSGGKRYAQLLSENIWKPMGGDRALVWLDREGGNAHTSCCLMATAMDWARLGELLLNQGEINGRRVVSSEWIAQMTETSPVHPWYGMHLWLGYPAEPNPRSARPEALGAYVQTEPFLAPDVYYFSGQGAQRVYVVPSRELVIVRLGPATGLRPLKPGWDNAYLVNTMIRGMTPAILVRNEPRS